MDETWREFATAHYRKLKAKNPAATFKEALKSAAPLFKQQKDQLYTVRGQVAAEHRTKARAARGQQRTKHLEKADRVEAHRAGGVLRGLKFDYTYGKGLFEDDLEWGNVLPPAANGGGGGGAV
jgi:hypothetical protein